MGLAGIDGEGERRGEPALAGDAPGQRFHGDVEEIFRPDPFLHGKHEALASEDHHAPGNSMELCP
jgi:hypothetical protein